MSGRSRWAAIGLHLLLVPLAVLWILPLWLMVTYSTLPEAQFYRPTVPLLPGGGFIDNWNLLVEWTPFPRALWNSVATSVIYTVASVFLTSLAGFAFARYQFFGKKALFTIVIATLTIPFFVVVIPQFIIVARDLRLTNTWWAVIIPPLFNSVGVFFMRQNFLAVPQEMLDAARVDGASEFRTFIQIAMPLVLPAVAALSIILFLSSWNNYLWPLLVLNQPDALTAPVSLGGLVGLNRVFWNGIMVATVVMTVPMLVVFMFLQRYFIAGITAGAVK